MGRPPVGKKAMTAAERQRRRRTKVKREQDKDRRKEQTARRQKNAQRAMPSRDFTEADRAEIEKVGKLKLSLKLCVKLRSLQRPDRNEPDEGNYHNVMKTLERRAKVTQRMIKVTQRMIEEFDPRSPADRFADEVIDKALAKTSGAPFDRHVFLSELERLKLERLKLAIGGAVADLRRDRAKGGRPWKIPSRYRELLAIYCQASGRQPKPTDCVGDPSSCDCVGDLSWIAFLCCAHGKLGYGYIGHDAMRARIKKMDEILDGIQAGLEAEDAAEDAERRVD